MPHCATRHLLQSFTHESMQMPETGSRVTILTLFGIYLLELTPLWGDPEDAPILRNQEREQLPLDTHIPLLGVSSVCALFLAQVVFAL